MNKQEYVKQLLDRLNYMFEVNKQSTKEYSHIIDKLPKPYLSNEWWKDFDKLSNREQTIYRNSGIIYSNSAIKRIRIELNTVLLEIEKGE